jgi:outer membrane protein TolC
MKLYVFFAMLFVCCFALKAGEFPDLERYIQTALASNTDLQSAQLAAEASRQESRLYSAWPDPALMIEGRGIPLDASRFGETRELMFMLEQMFPAPGLLNRMERRGELSFDIQNEMLRAVENDLRRQVKSIYFQLMYLESALQTNQKHSDLMRDFEQSAESKYIVNKTGQQDLYQIKIEQSRLRTERLVLEEKRASLAAEFNRLLNRNLNEPVTISPLPRLKTPINVVALDTLLESTNPFLRAARIRIAASENDIDLARSNSRPAFKVMGGYMAMNNMDDALMGRVGMTLPFMPWSNKDTRAAVEKSQVLQNKAEIDYTTVRDQLQVKMVQVNNAIAALVEQIHLYDSHIIPASEQTVSLSVIGYQADSVDFLSLLQYSREQLKHELRRDELVSQYWQKIAQLEYELGTTLDEVIQ